MVQYRDRGSWSDQRCAVRPGNTTNPDIWPARSVAGQGSLCAIEGSGGDLVAIMICSTGGIYALYLGNAYSEVLLTRWPGVPLSFRRVSALVLHCACFSRGRDTQRIENWKARQAHPMQACVLALRYMLK